MTLTAVATDTAKVNVIDPGKIIVKKETLPADSAQAFSFTIDSLVALEFSLKDGEVYTSPDLWPGVYHVTEAQVDGWLPPVASCENDAGQTNIPPDDIDLGPGQTVTCVFTNTQAGTIIVEKQTDPDGATGSFAFSGDAAGSIADGGQIVVNGLQPGAYTSQETVPTSWELTGITCDDANSSGDVNTATATFQLEAGETVKCTFNNLQLVPSLSVLKTVGEDANTCATTQELEVDEGTDVYFCFTLGNTGNVTLTEHILVDASLDVTVTFNYPLAPGDELQVTNKWLADNGKQTVLGPVTATEDFVNTVVYSSPVGEVILEDRSSAEVVLPPTGLDDDELPARERIYLPQVGGQ